MGYFGSFRGGGGNVALNGGWILQVFGSHLGKCETFGGRGENSAHTGTEIWPAGGEWVPLFEFPVKDFCPVRALRKLKKLQKEKGVFDPELPVFRFGSGKILTQKNLNKILAELLSSTRYRKKIITARSFRAGIPTDLERHPRLARDKHIKNWGRWRSSAY